MNRVVLKKPKKKQPINSESDRQKQAEKKKRRLEKALAASAAIISELEKKKQKKKEEQERLDEEGARVAEAVALHVLLGEDTPDDMVESGLHAGPAGDSRILSEYSTGYANSRFGWGGSELYHDTERRWSEWGSGGIMFPSMGPTRERGSPVYDEMGPVDFCPGLVAAQAVSTLQIREDGLHQARGW
ncbi:stress response NST1-like protein [Rhynchospora pubera]|uniref:Stress response NST1-like protein n=1 Tax=Rhynchospora pubera TaxID=906938 RepID=A0AAV8GM51_9POAL|nr:stress response NST1-like protein [Rhynchospora pubera]KAJ4804113.1 stress response NST1-like protein [Rhynchospora pubera]